MRRRDFLRCCGAAGLGLAAPVSLSSITQAAEANADLPAYDGPYYVVYNASGGWDTTYLMDPKGINDAARCAGPGVLAG
jgi:hypothetical protein